MKSSFNISTHKVYIEFFPIQQTLNSFIYIWNKFILLSTLTFTKYHQILIINYWIDWNILLTEIFTNFISLSELRWYQHHSQSTHLPVQNGCHFTDDIFRCIFVNEKPCILIKKILKFVPKGPNDNNPALVQIMALCSIGDMPLSEPMLTLFFGPYMQH